MKKVLSPSSETIIIVSDDPKPLRNPKDDGEDEGSTIFSLFMGSANNPLPRRGEDFPRWNKQLKATQMATMSPNIFIEYLNLCILLGRIMNVEVEVFKTGLNCGEDFDNELQFSGVRLTHIIVQVKNTDFVK